MASRFHLKTAANGQFHFNLHAGNGKIILTSELYKARQSALDGIDSVRRNAVREGAFEVKPAAGGSKYHFVLKATNGQLVGQSQMYTSEAGARAGCDSVRRNAPDAVLQDDSRDA
ncbi:TPA: YegP family protein [Klebsiella pneumoniae]